MDGFGETVSIVCPAYNAEHFISGAIDSVLAQSFSDWELVVVVDGGRDRTLDVALRYAARDSRIRVIDLPANKGVANARNVAMREAHGRWIAFLDADDYWEADKLSRSLDFALEVGAGFVYTAYQALSHDGQHLSAAIKVPATVNHPRLLTSNVIATSTVLIDRRKVGEFEMLSRRSEDFICWLEVLKRIPCAYGLNESLVRYRLTRSSLSRNKFEAISIVWSIYRGTERLGLVKSVGCLLRYIVEGVSKYLVISRTMAPLKSQASR